MRKSDAADLFILWYNHDRPHMSSDRPNREGELFFGSHIPTLNLKHLKKGNYSYGHEQPRLALGYRRDYRE